jgi:hypothetical protein
MRAFYCRIVCIAVIEAKKLTDPGHFIFYSKVRVATLDEITKEKERVGEALACVDAQREKLVHPARRTGGG